MKVAIFCSACLCVLLSCKHEIKNTIKISGKAQGTTYHITYLAGSHANYRAAFDSIFRCIDQSLSTYNASSIISKMNSNDTIAVADAFFSAVFEKAMEVSAKTNGLFDVTVAPLVNAYGFGFTQREKVSQALIDSLLPLVGYKKVRLANGKLVKDNPNIMLDFNAIAQGYTVDVLSAFLDEKGISDYLVELGGELKAKGKRLDGSYWSVGIEQPDENATDEVALSATLTVKDRALATSGNYKRFYSEGGKKYSHILDPFTGYPAKNNLLSATVVAENCMTADAYATAFMVMGLEGARQFLEANKDLGLEVLFIYDEQGKWKTWKSEKLHETIEIVK
jgi:thiamine biosynthesis lipoprotein